MTPGLVLIALVVACWAAPAAASAELPAAGQVTGAVASQLPAGAAAPIADTAAQVVARVESSVQATIESAASAEETAAPQGPAGPALPDVPAAPSVPAAPALSDGPAHAGEGQQRTARQAVAARVKAARVERSAPRGEHMRATIQAPAAKSFDPRPTAAATPSDGRTAGTAHGSAPSRAASPAPREDRPGGPDRPGPALGAAAASAGSSTFLFGGVALLVCGFLLAAPRLCRRLTTRPASWRPVGLVLLLERPG